MANLGLSTLVSFQVQLIYNEASLGRSVEIVLVRLEILQNENLPFYNEEVDKYLWDFCKWQCKLFYRIEPYEENAVETGYR